MIKKDHLLRLLCSLLLISGAAFLQNAEAAPPSALGGFSRQIHQAVDMTKTEAGEKELFRQNFSGLVMEKSLEEAYPGLSGVITRMNRAEWEQAKKLRSELTEEAKEFNARQSQYFYTFAYDYDVTMRRADTFAVSFLQWRYIFTGGPHGNYDCHGVNLSTLTGREIEFSDVFADTEALLDILMERLKEKHPEDLYPDFGKTIRECAARNELNWTLDPRGVTFYFNPYEVAPYACGLLTVSILFDEQPELFHPAYRQTAPAYAEPFFPYNTLMTSLNDNKKLDTISIQAYQEKLHIIINGKDNVLETSFHILRPVLLHMEDGRNYLYIEGTTGDNGQRQIFAFQVKGDSAHYIGTLPYTFRHVVAVSPQEVEFENFLTNPNGFFIDRNTRDESGSSVTDTCAVKEDGLLSFG